MIETRTCDQTRAIAATLARRLRAGDVVALEGPLGAGKTVFAAGLAAGLGLRARVTSPTFVIAKHYPGDPGLLHLDAYRLGGPGELLDLGLDEWAQDCVWAVEWADRVRSALPRPLLTVSLCHLPAGRGLRMSSDDSRLAAVIPSGIAEISEADPCSS